MTDYLALAMEQDREAPEQDGEDREELSVAVQPSAGALPLCCLAEEGKVKTAPALRAEEDREEEKEQEEKEPEAETGAGESGTPLSPALNDSVPVPLSRREESHLSAGERASGAASGEDTPVSAVSAETEELRPLAPALAGEMTLPRWSRRVITERLPAEGRSGPEAASVSMETRRSDHGALPLLDRVRRAQRGEGFVRTQRRAFTVTLPDAPAAAQAWSVGDLDRAVERDARRYGGEFRLY